MGNVRPINGKVLHILEWLIESMRSAGLKRPQGGHDLEWQSKEEQIPNDMYPGTYTIVTSRGPDKKNEKKWKKFIFFEFFWTSLSESILHGVMVVIPSIRHRVCDRVPLLCWEQNNPRVIIAPLLSAFPKQWSEWRICPNLEPLRERTCLSNDPITERRWKP